MPAVMPPNRARADSGLHLLARLGYAAKGLVYLVVAALAIQVAMGVGGRTTDPRGALAALMGAPFGRFLLAVLAVGLVGYAVWRFAQAIKAPEGEKPPQRAGAGASGLAYASLALFAAHLAWPRVPAGGGGGGGNTVQDWTARLMAQPFGEALVVVAGLGAIAFGVSQAIKGWRGRHMEKLATEEMAPDTRRWTDRFGRWGLAAFGAVWMMMGAFLVIAAIQNRPQEAQGLSGALGTLAAQPFGDALLGLMAIGLAAYGAYQLVEARFRRLAPVVS